MVLKLCWLLTLVSVTVHGNTYFPVINQYNDWWTNKIVYQLYPMSFKDSNGDGVGDLKGIMQKLDHFVDLGIEILWIGPIFKSPMDDMGYDVEDFKMIDPVFGTMDDFMELISEMNKRNLKMITDIVPNHSSYKCEWFNKSVQREGKYTDYYIWKDAKNQKEVLENSSIVPIPPNNWLNVFGGSGWEWNTERKQFYYHQFNPKQVDFNIRNPDIHKELFDIFEFWLDKGIAGFRMDAIKHLYEAEHMLDEPEKPGTQNSTNYDDYYHIYTADQPENIEIIYSWRKYIDDYVIRKNLSLTRIIATESYSDIQILMQYYGNKTHLGAHMPFNFGFVRLIKEKNLENTEYQIANWLNNIPKNMVPNWVIDNHDNPRIPAKQGTEMVPVYTALKLVLPGVDVTYYGDEIGMDDTYVRKDQRRDPNNMGGSRSDMSRDSVRSPMQWDDSTNAGFTDAQNPWLPVNPNYYKLNVEMQKNIPLSNYNIYKKMSQLRNTATLKYGDTQTYNISKSIYIVSRSLPEFESYIVVMNFGSETETIVLSDVLPKIKDILYVYLGSENSAYKPESIICLKDSSSSLKLRPESVVVLTDKNIITNPFLSSGRSNTQTSFKFISLFYVLFLSHSFFT